MLTEEQKSFIAMAVKQAKEQRESMFELSTFAVDELLKENHTLQQQNKQLIEALDFYGKEENWELPQFGLGHSKVVADRGEISRDIIKSIQGGT